MMPTQKAEALFDFEPTAEVELKMQKGDVVTVKRMSVGEGWWEGELHGKRGLFPSSFVKLLPAVHEAIDSSPIPPTPIPPTPLTPRSTKKAFMETLLAPELSTLDEVYDEERAKEVFIPGYSEVSIKVGPRWNGRPPSLTVVVKEPQTEPRFSVMKQVTLYVVETKELGSYVTRKYKQFLWLYDRLAENFPCVSLPHLPVKQGSGQERKDMRRKGLERFLQKVARHPVLGCTKFLKVFLTDDDSKSEKEWKIGKHLSHLSHNIKLLKTSRKLFHAPVYCTVKYPPYNVPISQLASIEKFSRFSRLLESNINTLHTACRGLSMSQRELMSNVTLLAKDLKCFAKGVESTGGAQRRKLQAKLSVSGLSAGLLPGASVQPTIIPAGGGVGRDHSGAEPQEESSGGEDGEGGPQWNWRDDDKFNSMLCKLLDLASGIQRTSQVFQAHQEAMEAQVMETLQEYSGVINTLPGLVRLHEEAMEYYNSSKNKDSKKEAEEVRQNCETLNNILLAEFDYFSNNLVEDFEAMMLRFLLRQGDFYRKLADEWNALHTRYMEHTSRRKSDIPIHVFPTSPTPPPNRSTSASHPHLHNLPPPSQHTPSETSSGGSFEALSHSPEDFAGGSFVPRSHPNFSQSQSHPNIHSMGMGHIATSKSISASNVVGTDSRPALTNSDTHMAPTAESAEPHMSPSYINLDVDDLRATLDVSTEDDQRLKRLSPLDKSIERELERSSERYHSTSSDGFGQELDSEAVGREGAELHPYANWQFEKMNEKSQKTGNTHTKLLLNGGPQNKSSERQESARSPAHSAVSAPRTPLKPPSPFRLQNLSDLTALDVPHTSIVPPPPMVKERTPPRNGPGSGGKLLGKALSTSKLHEIQSTDRGRGLADTSSHSTKNLEQLLPSQVNVHKPRSYTTTHFIPRKKPMLPPKRGSVKLHGKLPVMQEIVGTISEGRETLENSGELECSFEKEVSKSTEASHGSFSAQSNRNEQPSLDRDLSTPATGATVVSSKAPPKPARQNSPSSELMRKLSQRRQKLEQQLVTAGKHTSGSTTSSGAGGDSSSRCTSTSSTQSELVCAYHTKRLQEESTLDGVPPVDVELRSREEANLAKYGIVEDTEGGSYVI